MADPLRFVVIGSGVGGLAAAFRLSQRHPGASLTIIDGNAEPGGVTRTVRRDGLVLELGPDSIIRTKPAGMTLIRDLGLADKVQDTDVAARSSLIARGSKLHVVPEGLYLLAPGRIMPFVRSPIVSWPGKIRMLKDLLIPPGEAATNGGDETLGSFVRRRLGREALDRLAQPMVGGIYTADPEQLSLAATMPQFLQMEREYGSLLRAMRARMREQHAAAASGPRYGLFASLEGGLQTLVDALVQRLGSAGASFRLGNAATAVLRGDDGWHVRCADGSEVVADRLLIATPAWATADLLATVDRDLADLCRGIPYAGVATVNLVYRRDRIPAMPMAAGFVVPAVEGRSLVACTFSSRKYLGRTPEDRVVLRAFVGGALHAHHLERDDAQVVAALRGDLKDLLGITVEAEEAVVSRWPRAMAQYHVGHLDRVARIRAAEARLPGLALVSNGFEGVGIPDLAAQAETAVARVG